MIEAIIHHGGEVRIWESPILETGEISRLAILTSTGLEGTLLRTVGVQRRLTFTLGGGPISWSSKRQHTIATSSCEAEYIGRCNATKEVVWLCLLLREVGYPVEGPAVIFADNKSAIALANNPVYHGRSRHIDIQYHYTREKVNDNTIQLLYLPTIEMVVDGMTKSLDRSSTSERPT
jgi:hypothetical protein